MLKLGILPTETTLISVCLNYDYDILTTIFKNKIKITRKIYQTIIKDRNHYFYKQKMFDFLIDNDYILSMEDIYLAINNNIKITNKHKNKLIFTLHNECMKKSNIFNIKYMMTELLVMPDDKCLENACNIDDNSEVILFLISYGCNVVKKHLELYTKSEYTDLNLLLKYIK